MLFKYFQNVSKYSFEKENNSQNCDFNLTDGLLEMMNLIKTYEETPIRGFLPCIFNFDNLNDKCHLLNVRLRGKLSFTWKLNIVTVISYQTIWNCIKTMNTYNIRPRAPIWINVKSLTLGNQTISLKY